MRRIQQREGSKLKSTSWHQSGRFQKELAWDRRTGDSPLRRGKNLQVRTMRTPNTVVTVKSNGTPAWERAVIKFLGPMTQHTRHPGNLQF